MKIDKTELINKLDLFLKEKIENSINIHKDTLSVTLGGSHASGLATTQSDIDIRILKRPTLIELIGINYLEHTKLVSGASGINLLDDLDVELYTTKKFFSDLYHGEIIVNEMLGINTESTLFESELFKEIKNNLYLFKSKKFLFKQLGFYKGCYHQALLSGDKAKSPIRQERISRFGYDTKKAEQSIRSLEIIEEYLTKEHFSVFRKNSEWLRSIREGLLSKEEYLTLVKEKYEIVTKKIDDSLLPKISDLDKVNDFVVKFHKKFI